MDVSTTKKRTRFSKLKESYILFICTSDPFGQGLPVYTVRSSFAEIPSVEFNDKTNKVFYNTSAYKVTDDKELKGFLEFIQTKNACTNFSKQLEKSVQYAKNNNDWENEYMFFQDVLEDCKEFNKNGGFKF